MALFKAGYVIDQHLMEVCRPYATGPLVKRIFDTRQNAAEVVSDKRFVVGWRSFTTVVSLSIWNSPSSHVRDSPTEIVFRSKLKT